MAAPTTVLTIIKRFTYRGQPEEWSNTYMLTGATPSSSSAWRTLFDALVLEEKKLLFNNINIIGGYGYDHVPTTGTSAVWSVDLTISPNVVVPGTYAGSATAMSGDTAGWIRWGLDRMNSRGKRVYLRKYFHPAAADGAINDNLHSSWKTLAVAFGAAMDAGTLDGTRKITDRLGTATVGHAVASYATTRTLKRRGKRPPT